MGQIGVADLERRLGSDRLDVRLAAIDALERIMIDSVRDHPAIVELLAAFVRKCPPAAASGPDLDAGGQPERHPRPPADAQTAVTVLARRPAGRTERGPVNLAGAHLAGANLLRANLPGVVLAGAHLAGAHLAEANLFHADLAGADLSCADLTLADLSCANLDRATLAGSNLTLVNLISAGLSGADLTDADLSEASLDGTDLPGVTLTREQKNAILYTGLRHDARPGPVSARRVLEQCVAGALQERDEPVELIRPQCLPGPVLSRELTADPVGGRGPARVGSVQPDRAARADPALDKPEPLQAVRRLAHRLLALADPPGKLGHGHTGLGDDRVEQVIQRKGKQRAGESGFSPLLDERADLAQAASKHPRERGPGFGSGCRCVHPCIVPAIPLCLCTS
jgi:hypothetical protein